MTYVDSTIVSGSGVVAVPSGATGDVLCAVTWDASTPPDGSWTQRGTVTIDGLLWRAFTKVREAGDTGNFTFTGITDFAVVMCVDMSGVNEAPVIDPDGPGTGTTTISTSITPSNAGTLLFAALAPDRTLNGTPTGMTLAEAGADSVELWYEEIAAGATGTRDVTWTGTSSWACFMMAFENSSTTGPTIDTQPSNAHKHIGDTATFSVTASATGGGTLSYQWKVGGVNVSTGSGGTTASYTTAALAIGDDGNSYTCEVTETGGSNDGAVTTLAATLRIGVIFVASSTAVYSASGGTSVAPTYPAGLAADDKLVLILGQKPSSANGGTATTPSSPWALDTSLTGANDGNTGGYTTTLGADTGNCNIFAYDKTADGSESGSLSVTVGTNNVCWALMLLFRAPPGSTWSVAATAGKDTAAGNVSITGATDPGVDAGDYVVAGLVIPTDVTTPAQFSAEAFSQTGVTFGTVAEFAEPDSTTGNDIGGLIFGAPVTAGPSSAAPTWTATAGGTTTNVRGPGVFLRLRAGTGSLTITPSGLASAEAHGTQTVTRGQVDVAPTGLTSVEAHGTARIDQFIGCTGVASIEAIGLPTLVPGAVTVSPSGLASAEQHGTAALSLELLPGAIASAEAEGTPELSQALSPSGVATAEAHGSQTVTPGAVSVSPTGLTSAEAVGSHTVAAADTNISPTGVATSEAHGTQTVSPGDVSVLPSAIASLESHGTATVAPGTVSLLPSGIASLEAHGTAALALNVTAAGISTAEAIGSPTVTPAAVSIACTGIGTDEAHGDAVVTVGSVLVPTGIASAEAVGSHTLSPGAVSVICTGIATAEAHGSHTVAPGAVSVAPTGIATQEAHGTATVAPGLVSVACSGVATLEAHGTCTVAPGAVALLPSGVATAEAHGSQTVTPGTASVLPAGIASAGAVGDPLVELAGVLTILAQGIASAEGHGTAVLAPGAVSVAPSGVATAEQHGTPTLTLNLLTSAIASGEAAGNPSLALELLAQGLASAEAFGTALLDLKVLPFAIASAEAVGTGLIRLELAPTGVLTAEAIGDLELVNSLVILPTGIASLEAFGAHVVLPAGVTLEPIGIASLEAVGLAFVDALVFVLAGPGGTVAFRLPQDTIAFRAPKDTVAFRLPKDTVRFR